MDAGPPADATNGGDATNGDDAGMVDAATGPADAQPDVANVADAGPDAGQDAAGDAATADAGDAATGDAGDAATGDGGDASTCATPLLVGGTDVTTQGWSVVAQAPDTVTYGADYVRLSTSTTAGGQSGGQLLIDYPGAFTSGTAFKIQIVMQVESVNAHNMYDSAAAIMGSFHPTAGTQTDRGEMIYLDSAAMGWGDDSASAAFAVTDGNYHTYVLSVDAAGTASVSVDGAAKLTRSGFTTNGTLAIGDQTNDANVDSAIRIRSVTKLCP
jgi:hypothetical protein